MWLFSLVLGFNCLIWARFVVHQDLPAVLRCHAGAAVGHVLARQKSRMGLFVRTIGLARPRTENGTANLDYTLARFALRQRRTAPA